MWKIKIQKQLLWKLYQIKAKHLDQYAVVLKLNLWRLSLIGYFPKQKAVVRHCLLLETLI